MTLTIAVDAFGGDNGHDVSVPAVLSALAKRPDLNIILVGDQALLTPELERHNTAAVADRLELKHASQRVGMDELPSIAMRTKKDSSMRVAINLVKEGQAAACVSAGNTGALMATARYVLKTLPGVDRPAIVAALPTMKGHTHMLDLGANVDSSAEHLFQFAVIGAVVASAVDNIDNPTVGLLNIGSEEIKGNERVKEAARLLSASHLNYYGFVEGDDIFKGTVDVVVCDGFAGNIALKTSEGVARMLTFYMQREFKRTFFNKLGALMARPALNAFRKRVDPRRYNGASLLGLQGIVVKSHGSADAMAFEHAIDEAVVEVTKNVPQRISKQLESFLVERRVV